MRSADVWRLLFGGTLALGLLYLFFRGVAWREIGGAMRSADPGGLALVVGVTVVTYLARAWRWGYLLSPIVRVSFRRLFSATVVGFMTGLVIPRAGEVVRPYLVARRHGIRTSAAFATIILERLLDLLTVLALFFVYLYLLEPPALQTRGSLITVLKAAAAVAAVAALGILAVLATFHAHAEKASSFLDRLFSRLPAGVGRPLGRMLRAFGEGLAVVQAPPRHLAAILVQSLVVWISIAAGVYLNNRAFGIGLPFHASFLIIGFLTVGVAVPTPGMVGGFHESFLLALTQGFGVDKATAAAAGIALHALSNLPVLVAGLLFLASEGLTLGKVADMTHEKETPE